MQPVSGPYRILDSLYRIPVGSYTACIGSPLGRLQPWFFCVFCVFLRFLWSMGFRLQRPQCSNTKTRKKKKTQKTQKTAENSEKHRKRRNNAKKAPCRIAYSLYRAPIGSHTACMGSIWGRIQPVSDPCRIA